MRPHDSSSELAKVKEDRDKIVALQAEIKDLREKMMDSVSVLDHSDRHDDEQPEVDPLSYKLSKLIAPVYTVAIVEEAHL